MTDTYTTGKESTVVNNVVIGDIHIVCVTVQHDTAAGISTGNGETVDTRALVTTKAVITRRLGQHEYASTFFTKESSRFNTAEA